MRFILILVLVGCSALGFGQASPGDSAIQTTFLNIHYSGLGTAGDLSDRYGFSNVIGGEVNLKSKKNWLFGVGGGLIFGNQIKESGPIETLTNSDGFLINAFGEVASYSVSQRGLQFYGSVGKVIPMFNWNPNSGLLFKLDFGIIGDKMIYKVQGENVPLLEGDNVKAFDRFTSGFMLKQFIGLFHLSDGKLVNFYGGLELIQGFNKGRRNYQTDLIDPYTQRQFDFYYGLKISWMIPFYKRAPKEFFY